MRFAQIENGKVVNVLELEDNATEWGGLPLVPSTTAGIGDEYVNGEFVKPEPEIQVPQAVTMRQARLALLQAGHLEKVEAAINSLTSPQKEIAQIEWEYSQEVKRDKELVALLAPALGLDDKQLDDLFVLAAKL